ncbi:MAG: signal peptidase I [Proteobacteria bacterium]|nr:signal peptidase I [Pseudomonadota bacterium]
MAVAKNRPAPKAKSNTKRPPASRARSPKRKADATGNIRKAKWILCILGILAIAFALCFDIRQVNANAMMPTLGKGDWVLCLAIPLASPTPRPGSVYFIPRKETDSGPNFLRLLAGPGEHVEFEDDRVSIAGNWLPRRSLTSDAIARKPDAPLIWRETLSNGASHRIMLPGQSLLGSLHGNIQLGVGDYFFAGDNRTASLDSRHTGALAREKFTGRAFFVLWSARGDGLIGSWLKPLD